MLERLGQLKNADDFTVIAHAVILRETAADEVHDLLNTHPELRPAFDMLIARTPGG
jgi:hypothetical protein